RPVRLFCQDESRFGLLPLQRRRITLTGVKPLAAVQYRFENFYGYGAVEPMTGESFFLELPSLDSTNFQMFLNEFSSVYHSTLANQAARGRAVSNSSKASRGNCTNSVCGAEFTKEWARQRCRRTKAKHSAKVGSALRYQAGTGTGMGSSWLNCRARAVTSENSANKTGVVRAIACADHGRWVSTPRWARASSKVTSTDARLTTHAKIGSGVAWRSVQ